MKFEKGSKGYMVKRLQEHLKESGHDPGKIDRMFGEKTRLALVGYQETKGLTTDGIAGAISLESLGIVLDLFKPQLSRDYFKFNLANNPNYYGNLPDTLGAPVKKVCCDTNYEEIKCIGYQPQQEQLEAVVYVYQPTGYGTDQCGYGTPEYVRFYLSFDGGSTWEDQGVTSFQAYNIPEGTDGSKHLEYAASLKVDPDKRACWMNPTAKMRAILSWNNLPPENEPDWKPVWGNVEECTIVLEPRRYFFFPELLDQIELKPEYKLNLKEVVDLKSSVPTQKKTLGVKELAAQYKGKDVPPERFAFKELKLMKQGLPLANQSELLSIPELKLDPDFLEAFFNKDGDTSYEELTCIGLDPNTPNTLVGVINVKKNTGYSGGPCTNGSKEYVGFWADPDENGTYSKFLGNASVTAYDVSQAPNEGTCYAVRLPVDLEEFRQTCDEGPRILPIRAILSWNTPLNANDQNSIPTWGNREQTLINVPAKDAPGVIDGEPGKIAILGGIPTSMIGNIDGLTTNDAIFALNNIAADGYGRPCPFGGYVSLQGAPILGGSYMVEVSQDGVLWTPVTNTIKVTDKDGVVHDQVADAATKRFDYLHFTKNVNNLLAIWYSHGDELWQVRLTSFDAGGNQLGQDTHRIQLLNTGPTASIEITSGGGNCGKFSSGSTTPISGDVFANAEANYLRHYTISVAPALNGGVLSVDGAPYTGAILTETGPAGKPWELDITNMSKCGYTIHVHARDRAIVNSHYNGHYSGNSKGFCID